MFQARAVKRKHGYPFVVCRSFGAPSSIENPLYGQPPFMFLSFDNIYLEILSKRNTA